MLARTMKILLAYKAGRRQDQLQLAVVDPETIGITATGHLLHHMLPFSQLLPHTVIGVLNVAKTANITRTNEHSIKVGPPEAHRLGPT